MCLAFFFPILPWDERRGWVLDPPTALPAEAFTSPTADFDVTVHASPALRIVASGLEKAPGRWLASAVRDFAIAGGDFESILSLPMPPAALGHLGSPVSYWEQHPRRLLPRRLRARPAGARLAG